MAKRRTLRRQRDKALAELKEIKRIRDSIRHGAAMQAQEFTSMVARLNAFYEYHNAEKKCGFIDEQRLTRKLLHDLVDEGLFDKAVMSHTEPTAYDRNRFIIEVQVLKVKQ